MKRTYLLPVSNYKAKCKRLFLQQTDGHYIGGIIGKRRACPFLNGRLPCACVLIGIQHEASDKSKAANKETRVEHVQQCNTGRSYGEVLIQRYDRTNSQSNRCFCLKEQTIDSELFD